MVRAIIFDCFGVLIEDALKALCNEVLADEPAKRREVIDILHASHRGLLTSEVSNQRIAELLGLTVADYRARVQDGEYKNQPLLDYIEELHGRYKIGLLSNVSIGGITRRFTPEELQCFDAVVASGEVGYAKPDAEAYELTADRLGVRLDECVFTDDHEEYCDGARAVGMQAILYTNFDQFKAELEALL